MHNIQSPRTDDSSVEQLIQQKGKTAARVTPADVENAIKVEYYFTAEEGMIGYAYKQCANFPQGGPLSLLTFCVLVLKNGFTVTGESACASPENFDEEIGRKVARQNAVNKIWPLLGYELRTKLYIESVCSDHDDAVAQRMTRVPAPHSDLSTMEREDLEAIEKINTSHG